MKSKKETDIENIFNLLRSHAANEFARTELAETISRRSAWMEHLYESLGFEIRSEMNDLMKANYPDLEKAKPKGVRWKKHLYDLIGSVAPACEACPDMPECFDTWNK